MNKNILEILELAKLSSFRDALIEIIDYCWDIEHTLGVRDNANYDYFNSGTNGFDKLRKLTDSSNEALMSVNALISECDDKKN
ncbi:MAG: hypothetical protein J6A37_11475 [Oscillospiraceae bacterium]|nr:hypothetical protein [Oscillospiraceae bacterium]